MGNSPKNKSMEEQKKSNTSETPNFEMFDVNTNKCFGENYVSLNKCSYLSRVIAALKYYMMLNIKTDELSDDTFTAFCNDVYNGSLFLDDWIHIISKHSNQIEKITRELITNYNFENCAIKQCVLTSRHYNRNRNRRNDMTQNEIKGVRDGKFLFYRETMDSVHFYIFHSIQLGLRATTKTAETDNSDINNEYDCFDEEFAKKRQFILNQRKKLGINIERFNNINNKFNINLGIDANNENNNETTWMDTMLKIFPENF
eukprot:78439_1